MYIFFRILHQSIYSFFVPIRSSSNYYHVIATLVQKIIISRIYPRSVWPNVRSEFQGVETFPKKNGIEEKEKVTEEGRGREGFKKRGTLMTKYGEEDPGRKFRGWFNLVAAERRKLKCNGRGGGGERKERKSGWLSRNFVGLLVANTGVASSGEEKGWVSGGYERRVLNLPPRGKYRRTSDLSLYRETLYHNKIQTSCLEGMEILFKKKKKKCIARRCCCLKFGISNNRLAIDSSCFSRTFFLGDF